VILVVITVYYFIAGFKQLYQESVNEYPDNFFSKRVTLIGDDIGTHLIKLFSSLSPDCCFACYHFKVFLHNFSKGEGKRVYV